MCLVSLFSPFEEDYIVHVEEVMIRDQWYFQSQCCQEIVKTHTKTRSSEFLLLRSFKYIHEALTLFLGIGRWYQIISGILEQCLNLGSLSRELLACESMEASEESSAVRVQRGRDSSVFALLAPSPSP